MHVRSEETIMRGRNMSNFCLPHTHAFIQSLLSASFCLCPGHAFAHYACVCLRKQTHGNDDRSHCCKCASLAHKRCRRKANERMRSRQPKAQLQLNSSRRNRDVRCFQAIYNYAKISKMPSFHSGGIYIYYTAHTLDYGVEPLENKNETERLLRTY